MSDKNFDEFMTQLSDNIKNLGARIKQSDKKIEKKIKDALIKNYRDECTAEQIQSPIGLEYRKILSAILNIKLLDSSCYLGLPNEDWAVKFAHNLLSNYSVD